MSHSQDPYSHFRDISLGNRELELQRLAHRDRHAARLPQPDPLRLVVGVVVLVTVVVAVVLVF